jgi:hypothetical protein
MSKKSPITKIIFLPDQQKEHPQEILNAFSDMTTDKIQGWDVKYFIKFN